MQISSPAYSCCSPAGYSCRGLAGYSSKQSAADLQRIPNLPCKLALLRTPAAALLGTPARPCWVLLPRPCWVLLPCLCWVLLLWPCLVLLPWPHTAEIFIVKTCLDVFQTCLYMFPEHGKRVSTMIRTCSNMVEHGR